MERFDLTGAWWGRYVMPRGSSIAFWATLDDAGGAFTGRTSERYPPSADGEIETAVLRGTRTGAAVAFVKAYDGAGRFAHAVDYVGTLSPGGERVSGQWRLAGASGSFEMRRTLPDAEEETIERLATVDARA